MILNSALLLQIAALLREPAVAPCIWVEGSTQLLRQIIQMVKQFSQKKTQICHRRRQKTLRRAAEFGFILRCRRNRPTVRRQPDAAA
jgi:hypothetical protein